MIDRVILDKVIHFGKYISKQNIKIRLAEQLTNLNLYYMMLVTWLHSITSVNM